MKIAFDENMPAAVVRVFEMFQKERTFRHLAAGTTIHRAQEFYPSPGDPDYLPKDDAPNGYFSPEGGRTDMEKPPIDYGFRYRFNGRNYALVVRAESREQAEAEVKAMATAEFLSDLHSQSEPNQACL